MLLNRLIFVGRKGIIHCLMYVMILHYLASITILLSLFRHCRRRFLGNGQGMNTNKESQTTPGRRKKKSHTQGIIKTAKNVLSPMRLFEGKRKDIVDKLTIKFYIRFDQFHNINNKRKKESWLLPESVACLVQIHLTGHAFILQRKRGSLIMKANGVRVTNQTQILIQ